METLIFIRKAIIKVIMPIFLFFILSNENEIASLIFIFVYLMWLTSLNYIVNEIKQDSGGYGVMLSLTPIAFDILLVVVEFIHENIARAIVFLSLIIICFVWAILEDRK